MTEPLDLEALERIYTADPLDLDAVKRHLRDQGHACIAWGLIEELEATRAERDRMCRDNHVYGARWQKEHARAEKAEAALRDIGWSANQEEAHGERLGVLWAERQEYTARAERAEAEVSRLRDTIARVEALCFSLEQRKYTPQQANVREIRAALRGDQ